MTMLRRLGLIVVSFGSRFWCRLAMAVRLGRGLAVVMRFGRRLAVVMRGLGMMMLRWRGGMMVVVMMVVVMMVVIIPVIGNQCIKNELTGGKEQRTRCDECYC